MKSPLHLVICLLVPMMVGCNGRGRPNDIYQPYVASAGTSKGISEYYNAPLEITDVFSPTDNLIVHFYIKSNKGGTVIYEWSNNHGELLGVYEAQYVNGMNYFEIKHPQGGFLTGTYTVLIKKKNGPNFARIYFEVAD